MVGVSTRTAPYQIVVLRWGFADWSYRTVPVRAVPYRVAL